MHTTTDFLGGMALGFGVLGLAALLLGATGLAIAFWAGWFAAGLAMGAAMVIRGLDP
jgi:hypothetical protein